jgi:hypothetical protein
VDGTLITGNEGVIQFFAGANTTVVADTDNQAITFSSSGGGGGGVVDSITAGEAIGVDSTDPAFPIVSVLRDPNSGLVLNVDNGLLINTGTGLNIISNTLNNGGVISVNNLTAGVSLISTDSSITITPDENAGTINLQTAAVVAPANGLISLDTLTWTLEPTTSGYYYATASGLSDQIDDGVPLSVTLQMGSLYTPTEVNDASGWWLIAAYPDKADGGSITFFLSTNGNTNPTGNSRAVNIYLSWAVAGPAVP